jgi:hypothetical protein
MRWTSYAVAVSRRLGSMAAMSSPGWLQYAHPEHTARDVDGAVAVPFVNVRGTLRYQVSNSPVPGSRVVATVPYVRWLGRSGKIYVVDHEEPGPVRP